MNYALVTAAHNEVSVIENVLQSVTSQTILPLAWIIVSDGSTDQTEAVARRYARRFPFIEVIGLERDPGRSFVSKVFAVRQGFKRLTGLAPDYVGNLDADLSFGAPYFEQLLGKFSADPSLGIAGGWIQEEIDGVFRSRPFNSRVSVPHAVQLMRLACYEAIGDYVPLPFGGEDTFASVSARMQGWTTQAFADLPVRHHRRTASAGGVLRNRFRGGRLDYSLGYHPIYELLKCARRARERPYVVGTAVGLAGFATGYLCRSPRPVSAEFVRFIRREQVERFKTLAKRGVEAASL